MKIKDIKAETRQKLALNMHQAIVVYTIEFAVFITLIALISVAAVLIEAATGASVVAAAVICVYGVALILIAVTCGGLVNYAMIDFYLTSYKYKPFNVRRLGDVLARNGVVKIFRLNIIRTLLGFLLLLLLIVPGVIYLVRTSMANHLLINNPKMNVSTALRASNKIMSGKTGGYLGLMFSFFGWYLLGIVTLGVGFIFIVPYVDLAKTVYYKRNLQGDKTVYNYVAQPQSPDGVMQDIQPVPQQAAQQPQAVSQPVVQADAVQPIETLAAEDYAAMNAAMRDVGSAPEVPEVPLTPVGSRRTDTVVPVVEQPIVAEPAQAAEPLVAEPSEPQQRAVDDSSFVEIVTPLSTEELQASDALEQRRLDDLYAGASSSASRRDYISHGGLSNTDDGFIDSFDDPEPIQPQAGMASDASDVIIEPVQPEPIVRPSVQPRDVPPRQTDRAESAVRTPPQRPSSTPPAGESRAERMRREREERINKLRNSRK